MKKSLARFCRPQQAILKRDRGSGANFEAKIEDNGYTPLLMAALWGNPETVAVLLEKGANIEARTIVDGFTPLHIAVIAGSAEVREQFAQFIDPENRDSFINDTQSNIQTIEVLLQAGADIEARDNMGNKPFDYARLNKILLETETYKKLEGSKTNSPLNNHAFVRIIDKGAGGAIAGLILGLVVSFLTFLWRRLKNHD